VVQKERAAKTRPGVMPAGQQLFHSMPRYAIQTHPRQVFDSANRLTASYRRSRQRWLASHSSDATRHYGKNEYDSEPVHTGFKLRQLAFDDSGIVALLFGNEMNLNLKRLSLASARLEILIRTDTDLKAQFLELIELRERLQKATRARKPAPVVIVAAA
jgi:hypothetical protein